MRKVLAIVLGDLISLIQVVSIDIRDDELALFYGRLERLRDSVECGLRIFNKMIIIFPKLNSEKMNFSSYLGHFQDWA